MTAISNDLVNRFAAPADTKEPSRDELGQGEFMKLMLTQLRHQDPFKPMANGEFIAQMAQFSAVAGIDDMRQSLDSFIDNQRATQTLHAAQLVGKQILVPGDSLVGNTDANITIEYDLPVPGQQTQALLFDRNDAVIEQIDIGERGAGRHQLVWTPEQLAGASHIAVEYANVDGSIAHADVYQSKTVQAVSLHSNSSATELTTTDGQRVALSEIRKIF